jgi:hypothetical protein
VLVVLGVLALALPRPAYAAPVADDRVVFGGDFVLEAGEVLSGDLVLFGGNATLEAGSRVNGDVFLMGGNADIAGEVTGDVALLGGNVELLPTAYVHGDAVAIGGNLTRAAGARVDGQVAEGNEFVGPFDFTFPFDGFSGVRSIGHFESFRAGFSPVLGLIWFGFRSLLLAAVAVLVVMFWPQPTERTGRTAIAQPILGGGLGLLTIVVGPILLLVLAITILLIPVTLIGIVLLLVAGLFGWIAVGLEVMRLADSLQWSQPPAAPAWERWRSPSCRRLGLIPCVGWLGPFLVASVGLGGVMLTRFGRRVRQRAAAVAAPKPKLCLLRLLRRASGASQTARSAAVGRHRPQEVSRPTWFAGADLAWERRDHPDG